MAEVDKPFVARMHLVVDHDDDGLMIAEIGDLDPRMHREGVTGGGQAILVEDLMSRNI